ARRDGTTGAGLGRTGGHLLASRARGRRHHRRGPMNEVWLAPPFDRLWAGRDPFEAVEALRGEVFRELEARRTLRFECEGRAYFAKIHRGVGWFEIVENLVRGRIPVLGAANEFTAIRRLQALGVDTMRPVAFGQ